MTPFQRILASYFRKKTTDHCLGTNNTSVFLVFPINVWPLAASYIEKTKCFMTHELSLPPWPEVDQPMRYNSKLMNSIWGHYNEHSVHNFKSLQCGTVQGSAVGGAAAYTAEAVGQTMMQQPPSPTLNGR